MKPDWLEILCCPETRQGFVPAEPGLTARLNALIESGGLRNRGGKVVTDKLDDVLLRADRQVIYPVRRGVPILLVDEGITLPFSLSENH